MRESRDCQGRDFIGRGEEWLSLRQDQGAPVMCRAVEEEKVVLRVHDFRPDVKNVVRERREVKRCITEESNVYLGLRCHSPHRHEGHGCFSLNYLNQRIIRLSSFGAP